MMYTQRLFSPSLVNLQPTETNKSINRCIAITDLGLVKVDGVTNKTTPRALTTIGVRTSRGKRLVSQTLTPLQHALIVGSLLGDLHIQITSAATQRCRLRFDHTIAQKNYVDWKYSILKDPLCRDTKPPHRGRRGGYQFYSMYRDELISYREEWYKLKGGKFRKEVPNNIDSLLVDPVSLAVWYLDDGTKRTDSNACRLATQGFSLSENKRLRNCLLKNFAIPASIDKWRPKKSTRFLYGLSIQSKTGGYKRLLELIHKIVEAEVPTMLYKLK